MRQKVYLEQKELHSEHLGRPKSTNDNFKQIKIRLGTYFRLLEFVEDHRLGLRKKYRRPTFNAAINDLLDRYEKTKKNRQKE